MNQLKRVTVVFFLSLSFFVFNVSCFRGNNGNTATTALQSNELIDQLSSLDFSSSNFEAIGDKIADTFVNGMVSALQKTSTESFLETGTQFNFKEEAKKQAKSILVEMIKAGLGPTEEVIATAIKPPTLKPEMYLLAASFLRQLFNTIEKKVKIYIDDDIWDTHRISEDREYEEESGDSDDDTELNFD